MDMEDAVKLLESIHRTDPDFMRAEIYMLHGDLKFSNTHKEYNDALTFYKRANQMMNDRPDSFIKLGICHEKLREFDEAEICYKKALKKDKTAFLPLFRLGLVHIRNNNRERGIKYLEQAYGAHPLHIEVLVKLGEAYLKDENKIKESEELFLKALEVDNNNGDAHVGLGRVYEKQEKTDLSIEQFKHALKVP